MTAPQNKPTPISAYMITFNNERTVEKALQSLKWADEIIVVDSHSTDNTPAIVRGYADTFIQRDWPGFRNQYRYAAEQCKYEWAVFLDADEEIPPELATEIQASLSENNELPRESQQSGYLIPRRTWYLDRWIRHGSWASDREIRLYNRNRGDWVGGLHAAIKVQGSVSTLQNPCLHYTYEDMSDHLNTVNRYSTTAAHDMREAGKHFSYFKAVTSPPWRFFRDYLLKQGFRDGFPGLVIAVVSMFYVFLKHAKLKEIELAAKQDQ